jgi:hypothetical protein
MLNGGAVVARPALIVTDSAKPFAACFASRLPILAQSQTAIGLRSKAALNEFVCG